MSFPGKPLQNKREQLGFSPQDITDHLSIPADIIVAFESGNREKFPEQIFAAGFLRSYCAFLGIDPESMLAELRVVKHKSHTKAESRERSRFAFRMPTIPFPRFSVAVPPEVFAWVSVTALVLLGWFTYSTVIPSNTNQTEAMTINTHLSDIAGGRE